MRVQIDRSGSKRPRLNSKLVFWAVSFSNRLMSSGKPSTSHGGCGLVTVQIRHAQVNTLACTAAVAEQSDPSGPTKMSHRAQVLTEINRFRLVTVVFGAKNRF